MFSKELEPLKEEIDTLCIETTLKDDLLSKIHSSISPIESTLVILEDFSILYFTSEDRLETTLVLIESELKVKVSFH